jgi:hypothetical protein
LWELQAGEAAYPYHFQYADEELIVVMRGTPTPKDSVTTLAISSHGRPTSSKILTPGRPAWASGFPAVADCVS